MIAANERELKKIALNRIIKLIDIIPNRFQAVIRAKGFVTKY